MANRYTGTYFSRPAAQQVEGVTLFWAGSDANAATVWAAVQAAIIANSDKSLNKASIVRTGDGSAITACQEAVISWLAADGSINDLRIPFVQKAFTTATLLAALNLASWLENAAGSAYVHAVKVSFTNPVPLD